MALPIAHSAVAVGITRSRDPLVLAFLAGLSILPDLDWLLVWGFGLEREVFHRTFSHSIGFSLLLALLWSLVRPVRLKSVSSLLVFSAVLSHALVDLMCTANVTDHGVMLFWPLSESRMGWPILVPLYLVFAASPFSLQGALRLTLLEVVLALPLWWFVRSIRNGVLRLASTLPKCDCVSE